MAPGDVSTIDAPLSGVVFAIDVTVGDTLPAGTQLLLLESMKMHHPVVATESVRVVAIAVAVGDSVQVGDELLRVEPATAAEPSASGAEDAGAVDGRADLADLEARLAMTADEARAAAVSRRHERGQRTARENLADLVDPDSFIEYGRLAVAAQHTRRDADDLQVNTAADGVIVGVATVNGDRFPTDRSRTAVLAYDYTVLAGTQGFFGHDKTDRLLELAQDQRLPVIFYAEGGGGRPGDVDVSTITPTGLDVPTFATWAAMSGLVPRIGIASGFCFAGNAAIFGCADITIATRDSWVGMGGPAMIEGGGLGEFRPTEIGPSAVQVANGVIDLLADDEAHATDLARQALAYFQGVTTEWAAPDPQLLRDVVPEDRQRVYAVRDAIAGVFDTASVLELRAGYGAGMVTAFARLEGRPVGVVANDPSHLGGAIDAVAAEKAARFLQLCDAFDLPVISLFDTPGFMVGPDSEEQAAVRRVSSLFVVGATLSVPLLAVCLRKGYGLGAQAMCGGSFRRPVFTIAWPTGEFGGMGLEGAVRLGFRKELDAASTPEERAELEARLIAAAYERGRATRIAQALEIDAVIDPADTRQWLVRGLAATPAAPPRSERKRMVDTW